MADHRISLENTPTHPLCIGGQESRHRLLPAQTVFVNSHLRIEGYVSNNVHAFLTLKPSMLLNHKLKKFLLNEKKQFCLKKILFVLFVSTRNRSHKMYHPPQPQQTYVLPPQQYYVAQDGSGYVATPSVVVIQQQAPVYIPPQVYVFLPRNLMPSD